MGRRGFALVELMIGVAVVTILAAILIPRHMDVTVTARIARCHSNQRPPEAAGLMYIGSSTNADHVPAAQPSDLIPTFVVQLPTCPEGGTDSFDASSQVD